MYEINGVLAEKFHPEGYVLRMKNTFKMQLNTEEGVVRFVQEQRPFAEIKIVTLIDNEDKTEYFRQKVKEADEKK